MVVRQFAFAILMIVGFTLSLSSIAEAKPKKKTKVTFVAGASEVAAADRKPQSTPKRQGKKVVKVPAVSPKPEGKVVKRSSKDPIKVNTAKIEKASKNKVAKKKVESPGRAKVAQMLGVKSSKKTGKGKAARQNSSMKVKISFEQPVASNQF